MMIMRLKKICSAFCAISVLFACSVASFTNILHANAESLDICEQDDDSILMDQEIIDTTTISMTTSETEDEDLEKNIVQTGIDEVGYYVEIADRSNASAGILYYDFQPDGQIEIIGYKTLKYVRNLEIPKTINGVYVTRIDDYAFSYITSESTSISISLPDSITSIGEHAFDRSTSALSVTVSMPDSVTSIGDYAFYRATVSLSTLSSVKEIGENAFSNCCIKGNEIDIHFSNNLISIGTRAFYNCSFENNIILTLPDSLTRIEDYTFYKCNIAEVTIPSSIEYLGEYIFKSCTSLKSVTFQNGITSLSDGICLSCTSLSSVYIPDSVTSIGTYAFGHCESLNKINIPNSVTFIDENAFYNCASLTSLTISDSITCIENGTFEGCTSLKTVVIPEGVTHIGYMAFDGCTELIAIEIPSSITNLNLYAFFGDFNLTDIYYGGTQQEWETVAPLWTINDDIGSQGRLLIMTQGTNYEDSSGNSVRCENTIWYSGNVHYNTTMPATMTIVLEAPDESELYVGNQFTLSVFSNNYTGNLIWTSSDENIATIDSNGVITITGDGTVIIIAIDDDLLAHSVEFTIEPTIVEEQTVEEQITEDYDDESSSESVEESIFELGDIDGDNEITPTDAYICLVVYANIQLGLNTGMSSEQLAAADVNGDGTVDTMDSYYTLCYYAEVQLRGVATWSEILSR